MIRKITLNFNPFNKNNLQDNDIPLIDEAVNAFLLVDEAENNFNPGTEVCPSCGCKGSCRLFGTYDRYLIDYFNGEIHYRRLSIHRVICSCRHTHAILPEPIIPYAQYSLFFILTVLAAHFSRLLSVESICSEFSITPTMLYRWKCIFKNHMREWLGLLNSRISDLKSQLLDLIHKESFSVFSVLFIKKTALSFLQVHANPANCVQNLQFRFFP